MPAAGSFTEQHGRFRLLGGFDLGANEWVCLSMEFCKC